MTEQCNACQTIAPKASPQYDPKGEYVEYEGLKTYKTGPASAKKAVLFIYDIFGLSPQALQGADLLAHANAKEQYQVFIPDFLQGEYAQPRWFGEQTPEVAEQKTAFFKGVANPGATVGRIPALAKAIAAENGIESFAAIGQCWGAKVVALTSGADSPFAVAAHVHPSLLDVKDAEKVAVPTVVLASKDEDAETVKAWVEALDTKKYFETFADQPHGWMGARGDLKDPHNRAEYERGYATVLQFYSEHF